MKVDDGNTLMIIALIMTVMMTIATIIITNKD